MEIRAATTLDVAAVLPMVRDIAAFHQGLDAARYGFRDDPACKYRDWLAARAVDGRSVFLVADAGPGRAEDGGLAGFLVGSMEKEIPIYRIAEFGFIHDLWVKPAYRNEGIARQMVAMAAERFAQMGAPQVRLAVARGNEPALGLFAACGFRPSVTEMLLEISGRGDGSP